MSLVVDELVGVTRGDAEYVFHVPTSSFYELDETSRRVLDAVGEAGPATSEQLAANLGGRIGADQSEVLEILDDLLKLRLLVPTQVRGLPLSEEPPRHGGVRNVTLHVAHTCNLACGYCYAEAGLYKGEATLMTAERAREYIDWLFDQADPDVTELGVSFFGGEPLLNFEVIEQTARYAQERAEAAGKRIRFGITTNGTLVTPQITDFLRDIRAVVTVSVDAKGKTNDRLRPFHSGRGSYDILMDRIQPLLGTGLVAARVTVTRLNLDVVETVETLLEAGFTEVGCSPVDAKNPAYDLDGKSYAELLEQFRVLVRRFVDEAAEGRRYGFSNISNILKAIHHGHNKEFPCGAGIQMLAAAPDGKMSLCHRFVGEPDYVLGSLQSGGVDEAKRQQTLDAIALKERSDCNECWARYICSGGCHHVNFLFNGDPAKTYLTHCDWLRAWYRTGLEAYAEILQRNPSFIQQFIDPGWVCRN